MKIITLPTKEGKKQNTINFLQELIKDFESNKLDPEKCLVLCKWKVNNNLDQFNYYHNDLPTESLLALIELNKDKILQETIRDNA